MTYNLCILILSIIAFGLNECSIPSKCPYINKSVLIVGSSFPSLVSGYILARNELNVTFLSDDNQLENDYSDASYRIGNVTVQLPKFPITIFESCIVTRTLLRHLNINKYIEEDKLHIHMYNGKQLTITEDEFSIKLIINAIESKCISGWDIFRALKLSLAIDNFNIKEYREKYGNMTLLEYAKSMKLSAKLQECILELILTNTGHSTSEINAADALSRAYFYYYSLSNSLRKYYPQYSGISTIRSFSNLIVDFLRKQPNVKILNNLNKLQAFQIDPNGRILGDLNTPDKIYDYVLIGTNYARTLSILNTTASINTGAPKIFDSLTQIVSKLNKYTLNNHVAGIKILSNQTLNNDRPISIVVQGSPFPASIQSIYQLNKIYPIRVNGSLLQIIVDTINIADSHVMDKVKTELKNMFPELRNAKFEIIEVFNIKDNILFNKAFSTNRIQPESVLPMGIENLFFSANWVDLVNSPSQDTERLCLIGADATNRILSNR